MTEETALVPIKPVDIPALFATEGAIDSILAEIEKRATDFDADVGTAKGRKEIASIAHKVARSKTLIDGEGKKLVADMKAKTKAIDAERKKVRDFCDDLKERVRKPLDDWQAAEDERVAKHREAVEFITNLNNPLDTYGDTLSAEDLREKIRLLENTEIGSGWEEFQDEGLREKETALKGLRVHLERQEKYEAEQAELERFRKAEAERQAKEEAERKERERKEYEERIRKEAEEAANKRHRAKIDREAVESFVAAGYDKKVAQAIIETIASGVIKHVNINY